MKAIILAAGMGTRLRPISKELPKCLVEIEDRSLLEYSLDILRQNGIREVIVVIGYLGELIKKRIGDEYNGIKITYVFNERYSCTGSMYSFSMVKRLVGGDVLLLESDLVYEPEAIKEILELRHKDAILVAGLSGSGDEVYICVDHAGRIVDLGKNISAKNREKVIGEFVGISKFSKEFLSVMFEKAEGDYAVGRLNLHYEECVFETSKLGEPVYAALKKDLVWTEIDNERDLRKAKEKIYPEIKKIKSAK